MSNSFFDELFTKTDSSETTNFMTPTFENFARDKNYVLEITGIECVDGKFGKQLEIKTDAIVGDARESQPKIWVGLMEKSAEDEVALALPPEHPDHKKAAQMLGMRGRNLASFLRAIAPEQFNLVKLDKTGRKTVALSVKTGEELSKDDRTAMDQQVSIGTANFSKAAANGADLSAFVGRRFVYRTEARTKDPSKTNQLFLLESDIA